MRSRVGLLLIARGRRGRSPRPGPRSAPFRRPARSRPRRPPSRGRAARSSRPTRPVSASGPPTRRATRTRSPSPHRPPGTTRSRSRRTPSAEGDDYDLFVYSPSGDTVGSSTTRDRQREGRAREPGRRHLHGAGALLAHDAGRHVQRQGDAGRDADRPAADPKSVKWTYDTYGAAGERRGAAPRRARRLRAGRARHGDSSSSEIPNVQRPGVLIPAATSPTRRRGAVPARHVDVDQPRARLLRRHEAVPRALRVPLEAEGRLRAVRLRVRPVRGDAGEQHHRRLLEAAEPRLPRGLQRDARHLPRPRQHRARRTRPCASSTARRPRTGSPPTPSSTSAGTTRRGARGPGRTPATRSTSSTRGTRPRRGRRSGRPDEYHVFKINRIDPDTGDFDGIDWARIWGGRYRFMMLDLGAAPNPYEAETWGNRGRSVNGSATYDPPLWEYRANAPRPVTVVNALRGLGAGRHPGRDVGHRGSCSGWSPAPSNEAASFRFLHSYLYEPHPSTGRYWFSDNIWHDANADLPWASDLNKLYDQERRPQRPADADAVPRLPG